MAIYGNKLIGKNGKTYAFYFRDDQATTTLCCLKDGVDSSDEIELPIEVFHQLCEWLGEYSKLTKAQMSIREF